MATATFSSRSPSWMPACPSRFSKSTIGAFLRSSLCRGCSIVMAIVSASSAIQRLSYISMRREATSGHQGFVLACTRKRPAGSRAMPR
jgi:hypothetical protein